MKYAHYSWFCLPLEESIRDQELIHWLLINFFYSVKSGTLNDTLKSKTVNWNNFLKNHGLLKWYTL